MNNPGDVFLISAVASDSFSMQYFLNTPIQNYKGQYAL